MNVLSLLTVTKEKAEAPGPQQMGWGVCLLKYREEVEILTFPVSPQVHLLFWQVYHAEKEKDCD